MTLVASWEERMSAKAKARQAVENAEREAREAAEQAQRDREDEEACRADFEAGPPCRDCYVWVRNLYRLIATGPAWWWCHQTIETGDSICYHDCHDEPYWCGVIALA